MDWTQRIGRRLKPRDLHVFMAVAEGGSMAKAAERLAISRPVVSKAIAELESILSVRLLDRTAQGVELTRYGDILFKRGLAVFDELRQSVKEIEFLADPNAGELRVGVTEVPAGGIVPAALDRLSRRYPRMTVYTEQGSAVTALGHLRERRCELIVARLLTNEPDVDIEPLVFEQLTIVASKLSRWVRRRKIGLPDLIDEAWIQSRQEVAPGGPTYEAFKALRLDVPKCMIFSDSLNLRYGLLATGRFITMIPGSALHYGLERASICRLPIKLPRWTVPTSIVTLKGRTLSPLASIFCEELRLVSKPLARN
jgi:DNA-binding transcriptional LysR family regulator